MEFSVAGAHSKLGAVAGETVLGVLGCCFFLVTYLAPFPTPSQHVRAQKIPGVELVVCDSALIGL